MNTKKELVGWQIPGRYGIERVAYWLMRLTGLGLVRHILLLISMRLAIFLRGRVGWEEFLDLNSNN